MCEAFPTSRGGPSRIVLVGLGKREDFKPGVLRTIGGQIGRRLAVTKDEQVRIDLADALSEAKGVDMKQAGRCFGEGLGLIGWQNWKFKGSAAASANGNEPRSGPVFPFRRTTRRLRAGWTPAWRSRPARISAAI